MSSGLERKHCLKRLWNKKELPFCDFFCNFFLIIMEFFEKMKKFISDFFLRMLRKRFEKKDFLIKIKKNTHFKHFLIYFFKNKTN